ncbi:hypothetical protein OSB04_006036 [Centaurea solstitialis]|uniref:Uncharacterized protein n=1 Tax=Centaurea solstitialis TaxID=347529 RepID=A0AA38TSQ5_9ASTR|nr:hypothetical protein OSB04_006036 [Centaurea solstitialis]
MDLLDYKYSTFFLILATPSLNPLIYSKTHIQIIIKFIDMAKQFVVMKVDMRNCKKTRKALKVAAGLSGIDPIELTMLLRKGVGCTDLVSVGLMEEKIYANTIAAVSQTSAIRVVPLEVYPQQYYRTYGGSYYDTYEGSYYYTNGGSYYDTCKSYSNDDPLCTIM